MTKEAIPETDEIEMPEQSLADEPDPVKVGELLSGMAERLEI